MSGAERGAGVAPVDRDGIRRFAEISHCGRYRWYLSRYWSRDSGEHVGGMCFIMLNPSTADAWQDDATIRRCISFARRERCSWLSVVNLFAFRATDPRDLIARWARFNTREVVGHLCDMHLDVAIDSVGARGLVVAAWGPPIGNRAFQAVHAERVHYVRNVAAARRRPLLCLGETATGHPRHPVRLAAAAPIFPWPRR